MVITWLSSEKHKLHDKENHKPRHHHQYDTTCDDSLGPPPSNVFHGNQNDNERAPHDELPPVEVGSPLVAKQITQLLLNRVVPRKGDCLGLDSLGGGDHILAVPKNVLYLQVVCRLYAGCMQVVCRLHVIVRCMLFMYKHTTVAQTR